MGSLQEPHHFKDKSKCGVLSRSLLVIPKEILSLNPEEIDFEDKKAVRNLILKLLNVIESQAKIIEDQRRERDQESGENEVRNNASRSIKQKSEGLIQTYFSYR